MNGENWHGERVLINVITCVMIILSDMVRSVRFTHLISYDAEIESVALFVFDRFWDSFSQREVQP